MYPDIKTTRIEPQIEIAAPRVNQKTPKKNAVVPRVQITKTKVTAAAPRDPTPPYISQDEDKEEKIAPQPRYNTQANASANTVFEVNDLSVEVAMMATEIPTNNNQATTGASWMVEMANAVIGEDHGVQAPHSRSKNESNMATFM